MNPLLSRLFFLLGCVLVGINIFGIFQNRSFDPNRDPEIAIQTIHELLQNTAIPQENFIRAINVIVHKNIEHYWPSDPTESLRIPFTQNYLLYLASYIKPSIYQNYEHCSYERAIARGVGWCSQAAIVDTDILERKGIETHILYFNGHVAAIAKVTDQTSMYWLYLDPYFNVVIPIDFDTLNANPDLIRPYYQAAGVDDSMIDTLIGIMKNTPNVMFARGVTGYTDCSWKKITVRQISQWAKWILPILCMIPLTKKALVYRKK